MFGSAWIYMATARPIRDQLIIFQVAKSFNEPEWTGAYLNSFNAFKYMWMCLDALKFT